MDNPRRLIISVRVVSPSPLIALRRAELVYRKGQIQASVTMKLLAKVL